MRNIIKKKKCYIKVVNNYTSVISLKLGDLNLKIKKKHQNNDPSVWCGQEVHTRHKDIIEWNAEESGLNSIIQTKGTVNQKSVLY